MYMLHRFSFSALLCAILLCPFTAAAQDSFFDVFLNISLTDTQCDPCKAIADDITSTKESIAQQEKALNDLAAAMDTLEQEMQQTDEDLVAAQAALEEFMNPQNYIESEGRRYDSSDNAAIQRRSSNLWNAYKAGTLTAQEYSDEIAKPFDDPKVQKELAKLKKEIQKEMEQRIKDLKQNKAEREKQHQKWDDQGNEMTQELDGLQTKLDDLLAALEECEKQCKEGEALNPTSFGVPQQQRGFFDWFTDLFSTPDLPFSGIDTVIQRLNQGITDIVPTEIVPLQLQSTEPITGIPSPKCQMCDPIAKDIASKNIEISKLQANLASMQAQLTVVKSALKTSEELLAQARQHLEELLNPPSYVESEGRRYDSTDHAAMQVRNERLWSDYKSGKLSASDLEAEWGKAFDDPGVAAELDAIKKNMEKGLNDAIAQLKKEISHLNNQQSALELKVSEVQNKIGDAKVQLAAMKKAYELCVKQCKETDDAISFIDGLLADDSPWVSVPGTTKPSSCTGKNQYDTGDQCVDTCYKDVPANEKHLCHRAPEAECWQCVVCPKDAFYTQESCDKSCNGTCTDSGNGCFQCAPTEDVPEDTVALTEPSFLCSWFGVWCPKMTLDDIIGCANGSNDATCDQFDENGDGKVNIDDLSSLKFALVGPDDLSFPLEIGDMNGNDDVDLGDLQALQGCLNDGPPACNGLNFGLPGNDRLFGDDTPGLNGRDFGLHVQDGNDILLGDPTPRDLIHIGGGGDDILRGGPDDLLGGGTAGGDDLLGPGGDPFPGPPSGVGVDIFGRGGDDSLPPMPPTSEPNLQNDPQVRQVVQAAVQKYLKGNPLGSCEKLEVHVRRVRIGNRVRYTITIRRVQEDSLCIPQCPPKTSFQSLGTDCGACQNGTAGCTVIDTLSDGTNCILCAPRNDDTDLGCQYDEDCDDGDECTEDRCDRYTNECSNEEIEECGDPVCGDGVLEEGEGCEKDFHCKTGEKCNVESCECEEVPVPTSSHKCPDLAYPTEAACKGQCTMGECQYRQFDDYFCFFCAPKDLGTPPPSSSSRKSSSSRSIVEECDSPMMSKADCNRSCDGTCDKAYTTIGGLECYECQEQEPVAACGDGRIDPGEECDLSGCDSGYFCAADCTCQKEEDIGPTCSSGTTSDKSTCDSQCGSQGGVCIEENGCYSCVVVNCPDGTYKNECPSSCSNGCDVVGSQHGVSCYQCKQSCDDVCAQNRYNPESTDYSNQILSELNGYSCVSGANISIQTATIGNCRCIGEYSLSVDQTPPVCSGTPCGDVTCGSSATCADGDTQITVNCNWGGWEKIGKEQFRPKLGN